MVRINSSFNQNCGNLLRRRWPREGVERDGCLEFPQEIKLLGGHAGMGGGCEEGEEPDQVYGRGREQRLAMPGTLVKLSPKNKAEHPGIIEIKYCN